MVFHHSRVPCIAGGQQDVTDDKTKLCDSVYTMLYDSKSLLRTALSVYSFFPGYTVVSYLFGMKEKGVRTSFTSPPPSKSASVKVLFAW